MPNSKPPDKLLQGPTVTLIIGVVALTIGAIGLYSILSGDDNDGSDAANPIGSQVLIATQELPVGTDGTAIIDESLFEVRTVDQATAPLDALSSPGQLAGRTLAVPKSAGDTFTAADLADVNAATAIEVPAGMEAVAITLPFDPAVGGYVRAGDRVTVYSILDVGRGNGQTIVQGQETVSAFDDSENSGAVVQTLLRDVAILDVSADAAPRYGTQAEARPTLGQITYLLAVEPEDAARIIYTAVNEQIYLTLVDDDDPPNDQVRVEFADISKDPRSPVDLAATDVDREPLTPPAPDASDASDDNTGDVTSADDEESDDEESNAEGDGR